MPRQPSNYTAVPKSSPSSAEQETFRSDIVSTKRRESIGEEQNPKIGRPSPSRSTKNFKVQSKIKKSWARSLNGLVPFSTYYFLKNSGDVTVNDMGIITYVKKSSVAARSGMKKGQRITSIIGYKKQRGEDPREFILPLKKIKETMKRSGHESIDLYDLLRRRRFDCKQELIFDLEEDLKQSKN
jgi:hypothetical protein